MSFLKASEAWAMTKYNEDIDFHNTLKLIEEEALKGHTAVVYSIRNYYSGYDIAIKYELPLRLLGYEITPYIQHNIQHSSNGTNVMNHRLGQFVTEFLISWKPK